MSIKVSFKKNIVENKIKNYVLFSDEKFKVLGLSKTSLSKDTSIINKIIANNVLREKNCFSFNLNPNQKVIVVKLKNSFASLEIEKLGAEFYNYIKENQITNSTLLENNLKEFLKTNKNFIDQFVHGVKLKSYDFDKYKSKKKINYLK